MGEHRLSQRHGEVEVLALVVNDMQRSQLIRWLARCHQCQKSLVSQARAKVPSSSQRSTAHRTLEYVDDQEALTASKHSCCAIWPGRRSRRRVGRSHARRRATHHSRAMNKPRKSCCCDEPGVHATVCLAARRNGATVQALRSLSTALSPALGSAL